MTKNKIKCKKENQNEIIKEKAKETSINDTTNKELYNMKEIRPYIIVIVCVILFRIFIMTPIKVNGTSMMSTLHDGDTMILNKIAIKVKKIERFQIVVIDTKNSYLIKRVIGLPGERIKYKKGKLYINGKVQKDPYYKDNTSDFEEVIIPDNSYFVMGDNRSDSIDSRIIGTIEKKDIKGTTKVILFPFSDIGIAK